MSTGAYGVHTVPQKIADRLLGDGIELIYLRTATAAESDNERAGKSEYVAVCHI